MSESYIFLLLAFVGILIGAFLGNIFTRLKQKSISSTLEADITHSKEKIKALEEQLQLSNLDKEELRNEKETLNIALTKKASELQNLEEKLSNQKQEVEKLNEKFTKEFENLANRIFETKSEKFTKQNGENLEIILNPLHEKIKTFQEKVETSQKESIGMHSALKEQLSNLEKLNQQIGEEAINLTKALKGDSKTQGNWGELVLERVLEKSGLEKDREYFVQQSFKNNKGNRVMPDVVLHLPDNKKMIIDSKVSLTAYERYSNTDEKGEQEFHLKEHIGSIKKHIEQLSNKNYQDIYEIESPDFVLLFVPIEPAFAVALNKENSLYNWAFERNIVIVTPTTLLATLRTIDSMWNNEKQQQNAIEIATQAGRLYDQFVNLTDDLLKVGNQLITVQGSYETTMKKLTGKGNLLSKVEKLKTLGIKQKKHINTKLLERSNDK